MLTFAFSCDLHGCPHSMSLGHSSPREDQDLRGGAVMSAVIEEGEGDGTPSIGDLVRVHATPVHATCLCFACGKVLSMISFPDVSL